MGPGLRVTLSYGLLTHPCSCYHLSSSLCLCLKSLPFLLKKMVMTTVGLGLAVDPRGSHFKVFNLILSTTFIASQGLMRKSQEYVVWGTVQPSVWCSHCTLLCTGPILQLNTWSSQQWPGSHGA